MRLTPDCRPDWWPADEIYVQLDYHDLVALDHVRDALIDAGFAPYTIAPHDVLAHAISLGVLYLRRIKEEEHEQA